MKNKIFTVVKILVSLLILYIIFGRVLGPQGIKDFFAALQSVNKFAFLQFFIVMPIVYCIGSSRWWFLLRVQGIEITFRDAVKLGFIGLVFNNCMPGVTGGDLVKAYYIMRRTDKKARAVATLFVDRILGTSGLMIVCGTTIALRLPYLVEQNPEYKKLAATLYVIMGAVILGVLVFFSRRLRRLFPSEFLIRLAGRLPFQNAVQKVMHVVREMDAAFFLYRSHKMTIVLTLGMSCLLHLLIVLMNYGYGRALGIEDVSIGSYYTFVPIILLATGLPISVAGWGVGEGLFIYIFGQMGVEAARATALSIMFRLTALVWSLPGLGFFLFMKGRGTSEEMREAWKKEEQEMEQATRKIEGEEEASNEV